MATLIVRHRVRDYEAWKAVYDSADELRKQSGIVAASVYRDPEDHNAIVVRHQFRDMQGATSFAGSSELKEAMARAGVEGPPEIWIVEDVEDVSY